MRGKHIDLSTNKSCLPYFSISTLLKFWGGWWAANRMGFLLPSLQILHRPSSILVWSWGEGWRDLAPNVLISTVGNLGWKWLKWFCIIWVYNEQKHLVSAHVILGSVLAARDSKWKDMVTCLEELAVERALPSPPHCSSGLCSLSTWVCPGLWSWKREKYKCEESEGLEFYWCVSEGWDCDVEFLTPDQERCQNQEVSRAKGRWKSGSKKLQRYLLGCRTVGTGSKYQGWGSEN